MPGDIEWALRVAGGSQAAVAEAAAACGRDPATVLEAMRFYLQQSLLAEGGDPHRILGVAPGTDNAVLRRHHKLLQAWLHPDRNADPWNEVFATRVNQAWSALRSDRGGGRDADTTAAAAPAPAATVTIAPTGHWSAFEVRGGDSRARWLALAGVAACAVLLALHLLVGSPGPPRVHAVAAATDDVPAVNPLAAPVVVAPVAAAPVAAAPAAAAATPPVQASAALPPAPIPAQPPSSSVSPTPRHSRLTAHAPMPASARPERVRTTLHAEVAEPAPTASPPAPVPTTPMQLRGEPATPEPVVAVAPPPDPLARMREAQASLRATLAFLSRDGAPPLWNDPRAAEQANRLRDALHARVDVRRMEVTASHWVLRDGDARVDASYATGGRAGERGRLALRLVRREDRWLVSGLQLEPDR